MIFKKPEKESAYVKITKKELAGEQKGDVYVK